ncbi:unnamed protein product [Cladocopium goreaui]|uniref:Uncharacterized protein n=1 Tax=Cladocopium goreaui TaxID=2562237 RepID=A0A9P1C3D7_9DINO|nr:unnamed protein product [Cladocopium goreaui]
MKRQSDAQPGGDDEPTSKSMKTMSDTGGVGLDDDNEFAGLRGQLLVEAIFKKWGAGTMTIPWLNTETKERNIRRDGVNRPIMESLAEAYADRILSSGPNADRRAWMCCHSSTQPLPAQAITFNHRSEAMFRAIERDPKNPYVARALATGLENVRMLKSSTPQSVREALCSIHNAYHDGTGETWMSLLDLAGEIATAWEQKAASMNMQTRNTNYETTYEKFVFKERAAEAAPCSESFNYFKITNVLNNHLNRFNIKGIVRDWCNTHMNFADFKLVNRLGNGQQPTARTVPTRNSGTGERLIPQIFAKTGAETLAVMNYVVTPMSTSSVFKKLEEEAEARAGSKADASAALDGEEAGPSRGRAAGRGRGGAGGGGRKQKSVSGKAKAKAKATSEAERAEEKPDDHWSPMASPLSSEVGGGSLDARYKTALDDAMHVFNAIASIYRNKVGEASSKALQIYDQSIMTLFGHTISCFFEFAWSGTVAINGKFVRTYSGFRQEISTFITTACELASTCSQPGKSRMSLATHISDVLDSETGLAVGHGMKDESDEARATNRIVAALSTAAASGMVEFVNEVLELPLEFHAKFSEDHYTSVVDSTAEAIEWNFGDADEEAQAFSTGNVGKVAKVNKKLQAQRLIFSKFDQSTPEFKKSLRLPYLGHVSTVKSGAASFCIGTIFDCNFYMNPLPTPSPASPTIIPAWLIPNTNKPPQATLMEKEEKIQCVLTRDLKIAKLTDAIEKSEVALVDLRMKVLLGLSPNELVFQNAEKEKATELPLIKYQHKKKDGDEAGDPMEKEQLFGYPFALLSRRTAMEAAGMSTALPSLSKEQKKAEKDKKKALVNAKHLLR